MNYTDLAKLNGELDAALINAAQYHSEMDRYLSFYKSSAFYPSKSGQARSSNDLSNNLLRVYANANINFTNNFPTIKVPTTGATSEQRQAASIREKILQGVWRKSGGAMLQRKWGKDATLLSIAVSETGFDLAGRCAFVKRYDPRYCFWQLSNGNEKHVEAFWAVVPITAEEAFAKYGVRPTTNGGLSNTSLTNTFLNMIDGKTWFLQAIRWDEKVRVAWIGDVLVEEAHDHQMGGIPIDLCVPFDDLDSKGQGAFYLEPMVNTQANLNLTIQRRDNLVARYAHPVTYGKGIMSKQLDDIKQGMKNGGFIGLKSNGEIGIVQIKEIGILNDHERALRDDMMRLSGFSAAAMGELAGANTSGDALGMYFTPTQRHIENQNIAWIAFYQAINAKILRMYEKFGKTGETFSLSGYSASGTLMPMVDNADRMQYVRGGFDVQFDKSVIDGNYNSLIEMHAVTPKNEIDEKRLILDAVTQKFLSRTTAYERFGIESPEDELALLQQEQSEPALNPQGMQQLMQAAQIGQQQPALNSQNPPLPTTPAPVAKQLTANVQ